MSGLPPGTVRSGFVEAWVGVAARALGLPAARRAALDLAAGEGRHTTLLAQAGFATFGVDLSLDRLLAARDRARSEGVEVRLWAADLDTWPLPRERFDLLLVSRFLLRARWEALRGLVRPSGFVVYETFTVDQVTREGGPRSPDHLLHPGELAGAFGGWEILFAEETAGPTAMARLAVRKPAS